MEKIFILLLTAVLLMVSFLVASQPTSDEAVIAIYLEHHNSLTQLVQLYHTDQVGMIP